MVFDYVVRTGQLALPGGTGVAQVHVVCRAFALSEQPAVAIFLCKQHAEEYAVWLTKEKIEVL
jgi:hypothetical protein